MGLSIKKLHPTFGGEVDSVDLRKVVGEQDLQAIRAAMDEYAVLVFRDQVMTDARQIAFAGRLDGQLHTKTGASALHKSRLGNEAIADVSNVDAQGRVLKAGDRRRLYGLGNRLWHTDASFQNPAGRYSMLSARVVPPVATDTQFADTRAAYDALLAECKAQIEGLEVHHSIAYSRQTLGFEFSATEQEALKGAYHPLVRKFPNGRRALYIASHASMIRGWPLPEGRLLLRDLMEHATQAQFVFSHSWRVGDFVIWDNRMTMHRASAFDDKAHAREMRRVTTLDIHRESPVDNVA